MLSGGRSYVGNRRDMTGSSETCVVASGFVDRSSSVLYSPVGLPTWFRDYKSVSCSNQLSIKFKLLINIEIVKINVIFMFESLEPVIYPANKC